MTNSEEWPTVGNGREEWISELRGGRGIRTQDHFGFWGSGIRTQDYLKFSFGAVVIPLCYREFDDNWLSKYCVVLRNVSVQRGTDYSVVAKHVNCQINLGLLGKYWEVTGMIVLYGLVVRMKNFPHSWSLPILTRGNIRLQFPTRGFATRGELQPDIATREYWSASLEGEIFRPHSSTVQD